MNAHHHHNTLDWYRPGLGESWIIVLIFLLGSLFFGVFLSLLKTITPAAGNVLNIQTIAYLLAFVAPAIFIAARARAAKADAIMSGAQPERIDNPRFGKAGAFVIFALSAAALVTLSVAIEPITYLIPMPDSFKSVFEQVFVNTSLWDAILCTCILAPILEELLCRGVIMRGILRKSTPWKAILWSAFIFAVIHMNPWQSIPAFAFGVLFGWVYYRTGCLWLTIFLHFLNNSLSTLITRLFPDIGVDQGLIDILPRETYIYVYIASILILAGSLFLLHKLMPDKTDE